VVVNMFGFKFPSKFSFGAVKVDGHRHIASVIVLFEQCGLMFLNVAFKNSRTRHLA